MRSTTCVLACALACAPLSMIEQNGQAVLTVSDHGPGIAASDQVPAELLIAGTEVHGKVRCGNHALGYSLFYGVSEFFYEKVIFFF